MTKRSHVGMALTLAAALGLAACGSTGSTGPSFSGTITTADADTAGANAADFAGALATTFNFGKGPSVGLSAKASPRAVALLNGAWMLAGGKAPHYRINGAAGAPPVMPVSVAGCASGGITVGDTTDSDHDSIPNNLTVTISCDTTYPDSVKLSIHGTIHIQDITGLYGYQFSVNLSEVQSRGDTSINVSISGTDNASFTTTSANDNLNFTLSDVFKQGTVSTGGAFHQNWDATFTPTGTTLSLGNPLPDGTIAFTGGFYVTDAADPTHNFNFNILTAAPLSFSAACQAANDDPVFTAGVIQGKFNGSATVGFTATFTGCNTAPTVVGTGNAT